MKKGTVLIENDEVAGYNLNTNMQPGDLMDLLVSIVCKIAAEDKHLGLDELVEGIKFHYARTIAGDQGLGSGN